MSSRNTRIITEALERGLSADDEPMSPIMKNSNQSGELTVVPIEKQNTPIIPKVLNEPLPSLQEAKDLDKQLQGLALPGNPVRNLNQDFFSKVDTIEDDLPSTKNKGKLLKYLSNKSMPTSVTKSSLNKDSSDDNSDSEPVYNKSKSTYESSDSSSDLPMKMPNKEPTVTPSEKYISSRVKLVPFQNNNSDNIFSSSKAPIVNDKPSSRRVKSIPFVSSYPE